MVMDFRELFRGFFGLTPRKNEDSPARSTLPGQFFGGSGITDNNDSNSNGSPNYHRNDGHEFPTFFSTIDMFTTMEEMFKEVEQSMKEMEDQFEGFGFGKFTPYSALPPEPGTGIVITELDEEPPALPPPSKRNYDENLRGLVLKEDSKPKVIDKDKVDKNLDELYQRSMLDLSDLPVVPQKPVLECGPHNSNDASPFGPSTPSVFGKSTFERVYSTHSFNNGKWEGKTVRENERGKEVTTYYRDQNGDIKESKEYFPKDSNQPSNQIDFPEVRMFNPLSHFLETFFKPRL